MPVVRGSSPRCRTKSLMYRRSMTAEELQSKLQRMYTEVITHMETENDILKYAKLAQAKDRLTAMMSVVEAALAGEE
jgi:hypothetical protein